MLVRKGVGWDDPLGEDERAQLRHWLEDLPELSELRVNRCFKPAVFGDIVEIQLHLFSDSSRSGYSAVAFLRLTDSDRQVYCAVCNGKGEAGAHSRNFNSQIGINGGRCFSKAFKDRARRNRS